MQLTNQPSLSAHQHRRHHFSPKNRCHLRHCLQVPPEILKELQPYIQLAEGLGKAAVGLVKDSGFTELSITYSSPRGDDLDTRLLRAMVIKGVLEGITTSTVNLVNADLLAKNRGLKITEVNVRVGEGSEVGVRGGWRLLGGCRWWRKCAWAWARAAKRVWVRVRGERPGVLGWPQYAGGRTQVIPG